MEAQLISTREAAAKIGVSQRRINHLIKEGRLPARKVGSVWIIEVESLKLIAHRKPGRPRKKNS